MTSSSRRKRRIIGSSSLLVAVALACGSCGGPTAPTANVTGVWVWNQRLDAEYLFLEQQAETLVGWYCYVGTGGSNGGAISGSGRVFSWPLPWSPPGQTATATIQSTESIIVQFGSPPSVHEFRRATFDPPRTGACNTTLAMPR